MSKLFLASVVALVLSTAGGIAAEPTGTVQTNDNAKSQGSTVGVYSSQVKQNGQVIGGNHGSTMDQTTEPGSRAEEVQGILKSERKRPRQRPEP